MANNNIGGQIGEFLGGIFNPLAQVGNTLAGTTKVTETTGAAESAQASRRTATIIIAVMGVITLVAVAYYLFKNKAS